MKARVVFVGLLAILCAGPAFAAKKTNPAFKDLLPGRYAVKIKGMMTLTCAKRLELEFSKNPRFSQAKADFEADEARFTVTPGPAVSVSELKGLIKRASARNNLVEFEFVSVRYIP